MAWSSGVLAVALIGTVTLLVKLAFRAGQRSQPRRYRGDTGERRMEWRDELYRKIMCEVAQERNRHDPTCMCEQCKAEDEEWAEWVEDLQGDHERHVLGKGVTKCTLEDLSK